MSVSELSFTRGSAAPWRDDPARDDHRDTLTFTLLGPLEVHKDGHYVAPSAPKPLQLLAMLLTSPKRLVPSDSLIEELWSSCPPRSVRTTLQTYVYQLRKTFERSGLVLRGEELLVTKPLGYLLQVDPVQVDVFGFQQEYRQGRRLLGAGRYDDAAERFHRALAVWSGPALANVNCGPLLSAFAVDLQEQRRNARHLRIEAEIEGGLHRELIGELRSLAASDPLDEGVHGQLMRVLGRSGRRSEAMEAYRQIRGTLDSELGVEPGADLQRLYVDLLSA